MTHPEVEGEGKVRISDDGLRAMGFKWHEVERSPSKHWTLWIAPACVDPFEKGRRMFASPEDLGIELTHNAVRDDWFCWLRADYAGRYTRLIHVRHVTELEEVVAIIEALTGRKYVAEDCFYGAFRSPEDAARLREDSDSLHMRLATSWGERVEKEKDLDPTKSELVS